MVRDRVMMATTIVAACALLQACGAAQSSGVTRPPAFVVIDAGAAPRQLMRYQLASHAPEEVEIRMTQRSSTGMASSKRSAHISAAAPTMRVLVRVDVAEATGSAATVTYAVEDAALLDGPATPEAREKLEPSVAAMKGARGSWRQDLSGRLVATAAGTPTAAAAVVADFLRGATIVFPEAAIGVGATWRETSQGTFSGITWDMTSTYRLKSLVDSTATVEVATKITAPPQAMSVEPTRVLMLDSASGDKTADVTVLLDHVVATGVYSADSEANLKAESGRSRTAISMQIQTQTTVTAGPTAAPASSR